MKTEEILEVIKSYSTKAHSSFGGELSYSIVTEQNFLEIANKLSALSSPPVQRNKEDAIILALVRCVIATNPNDAISHQIMRLYSNYVETDQKAMADRLHELLNPSDTGSDFKIVQSTPSEEVDAGKEHLRKVIKSFEPVFETFEARMEKIIGDAWDAGETSAYDGEHYQGYEGPTRSQYIKEAIEQLKK